MGREELLKALDEDAGKEKRAIIEKAKAEAEAILAEAEAEIKTIQAERLQRARASLKNASILVI